MRRLLANGWIVTMDDAAAEHDSGWVLVDGSVVSAVGDGVPPEADEVIGQRMRGDDVADLHGAAIRSAALACSLDPTLGPGRRCS